MTIRRPPPVRPEAELLWFRRRSFLQAATAFTAAGGFSAAFAQQRGNIVELVGDVRQNGQSLRPDSVVQTGDVIQTGPGSTAVFVIGNSAFHVRQNSTLLVERGATLNTVSVLRLISGAVVSAWGRGGARQIVTPTLTAGIRGTGLYTELVDGQRTYFCNCYGEVELVGADGTRRLSRSQYHEAVWAEPGLGPAGALSPAPAINHSDEELEFLGRLVGQRTAWQVSGVKGRNGARAY